MAERPSLFRNEYHSGTTNLNAPGADKGGINVTLIGQRLELQVYPIHVTKPDTRYDFELLAKATNERIIGFMITSDEVSDEISKDVNHGTLQLTIDNTEIFPSDTDSSLFTQKLSAGFYENMYDSINEKASASSIKGHYKTGSPRTFPDGGYTVKLYFIETAKQKL